MGFSTNNTIKISSSLWKTEKKSSQGALKLEVPKMPKVAEFDHLSEDGKEAGQFCVKNEYEDDDENDAYEIVNPTRPRSRPRYPKIGCAPFKKDRARAKP